MTLKTIVITLAMIYRKTDVPEPPHGGAMWVVDTVLGKKGGAWSFLGKVLGAFFCITLINSTLTGSRIFQSRNVASLTEVCFVSSCRESTPGFFDGDLEPTRHRSIRI